jgi:hypothetical protein
MLSEQQRKAETARVKVEARSLELGVICCRPSAEGTRYDCVLDIEGELYRAQIKYCNCSAAHASGAISVRLRSNVGQGAARCYSKDEVDALLVARLYPFDRQNLLLPAGSFLRKDCN